jgi:L,D-peptidoglycan transpeptidase YkuD (ErfK/YbiS/YcfS/YnhG family)
MTIFLKNKHTLKIDDFYFKCCIGKNGVTRRKREGDYKTPSGFFKIGKLFFREDRMKKPKTFLKVVNIDKNMGWCDDINYPKKYNKLIKSNSKIKHEKLKRKDQKYDLLIPINYNSKNPIPGLGSCIFIHLTKNYEPTAGCIALKKKDFLIMLKIINKSTKIKIY